MRRSWSASQKELTKARENLERIEKKLQNESFVSKAPEAVVNAEREKADKARALIAKLEESAAGHARLIFPAPAASDRKRNPQYDTITADRMICGDFFQAPRVSGPAEKIVF